MILAVVIEPRLPLDDVHLVDVVLDHRQRLVDVVGIGGRTVGPPRAAGDHLQIRQRLLIQLGVGDGVDRDASLAGVAQYLLHVRGAAVVAAVGDQDDRLGRRQQRLGSAALARRARVG